MRKPSLAAAILVLVGVSCGTASAATLAVTMSHADENFLTIISAAMGVEAKARGVHVQFEDAQGDVGRQISQVQNFVAAHVDAIIVNAVDSGTTATITGIARAAKIPLVYVNRGPAGRTLPDGVVFVCSDDSVAGRLQGEELARLLGGKGRIVIMEGELSDEASHKRTEGVEKVVALHPGMAVVEKQTANYQRSEAIDLMTNWISGGEKIDAVAANNDEMAIGAIIALQQAHRAGKVVVAGVDATADGLKQMQQGNLAATVFQNGREQGRQAVDTAIALIGGGHPGSILFIPFELVTRDNYRSYMGR